MSDHFVANITYTATITILPKPGYVLTGVEAGSFTVSGASRVTNEADSGIVTVEFPLAPANLDALEDAQSATIGTLKAVRGGTFFNGTANMTVSGFRMSRYEITRAMFEAVMGVDPSYAPYSGGNDKPVQKVSWRHAIAFCNKLSLLEGLTPVYSVSGVDDWAALAYASVPGGVSPAWDSATADWSANGYRLPTEAEWMWAAMGAPADGQGGGVNESGYLKPFSGSTGSNAIGSFAVFGFFSADVERTTTQRTNAVGSKQGNEMGVFDLTGNVWEWCWDVFETSYPSSATIDYRGAASGANRVVRGGAWSSTRAECAIAERQWAPAEYAGEIRGFRVVRQ